MTGRAAIRQAIEAWLSEQPAAAVGGETVGRGGDLEGFTTGLLAKFGPDRVVDLPAADATVLGWATGRAISGRPTLALLPDATPLPSAAAFLADATASQAPLILAAPSGAGAIAPLLGVPVFVPCDPNDVGTQLAAALRTAGPVVILWPHRSLNAITAMALPVGKEAVVLAWGDAVSDAVAGVARSGVDATVLALTALNGDLDPATLSSGRIVVAHRGDPAQADRVRLLAMDAAFEFLECPTAIAEGPDGVAAALRAAIAW